MAYARKQSLRGNWQHALVKGGHFAMEFLVILALLLVVVAFILK